MKKKFLLYLLLSVAAVLHSQTFQQTGMELDYDIAADDDVVFEASAYIKMLCGFHCSSAEKKSAKFSIDRFGVFPPDEGLTGGASWTGQEGVASALPGELDVDELGAAVYSIPIMMPQGIGGMTPDLAVTYNSQAGNGLLGWGWNLTGLSSITRVGQTLYHDDNQTAVDFVNDRYVMDGKRLMVCSGNYGAHGSEYKTEIDEMSRIVAYSEGYDGPARFVVYKKDGSIWEYGGTDDSRIEPQNRDDVALTWLVNKISDRDGNAVVFNYDENQSAGEYCINSIDYTLNDRVPISYMYRVSFVYSDRDDVETGYVCTNHVRHSKLLREIVVKNMISGSILYDYSFDYLEPGSYSDDYRFFYYRLRKIGMTADGMKVSPTLINWNKGSHYSNKFLSYSLNQNVFNKVPFIGDFNGDGYSDVITVPYKTGNSYTSNVQAEVFLNNGNGSFAATPFYTFDFYKTLEWVYVVDLNGDGLDDVVAYYANNNSKDSWKSRICAFINEGGTFTSAGEFSGNRYFTIHPGDFCGEKKVSFFLEYDNRNYSSALFPVIVYYNNINNSIVAQSLGINAYSDIPERVVVEDVNADGRSEIIYLMGGRAAVAKLLRNNNWYSFLRMYYYNDFDSDDFLFPGDFNGDGYTDFLKYDNRTYWKIAFSNGNGFDTPVPCMNNVLLNGLMLVPQDRYVCSLENLSMPSVTIRTADFDGDGKSDVAVFNNIGGNYYAQIGFKMCALSNDSYGFSDCKRFYFGINFSHQYVHVGNFLGKENVSVLGSVKSNPYSTEIPKIVALNSHFAKYGVERITDGLGNVHGFRYEYLMPYKSNAFYTFDYQCINPDLRTVSVPLRALFADTVFSTNGSPCVTRRAYWNALYHTKGHGLLGMERCETKFLVNNVVSEMRVLEKDVGTMADCFIMLPKSLEIYNGDNNLVKSEQYFYEKFSCTRNDKVVMPMMNVKKLLCYDYDASNTILKTNIENYDYQGELPGYAYNDVVIVGSSTVGVDNNYSGDDASSCAYWVQTDYSYDNDTGQWVVARVKNIRRSKHYEDNDAVGTCEIFDYAGQNPFQVSRKTTLPNTNMNYADPLKLVAEYTYDAVGHTVTQSLTSPSSKSQKTKSLAYSDEYSYRFPTSKTNENGWEINMSYDNDYGNVLSTLDYNQFETGSGSDAFSVNVETTLPDGVKNVKAKRWAQGHEHAPQNAAYYYWEKSSGNAEKLSFYHKNGKKLRDVTFGLDGEAVYVDITYDDKGNISSQSMPYVAGNDKYSYFYVYDKNNRLIEEVYPNGLQKSHIYNGLKKIVNTVSPDGLSRTVTETYNPAGWRVQTVDIGGNAIDYQYYSDGKLKSATVDGNASTRIGYEYDGRRNLTKINDPASGEVLYEYNAFDELEMLTTARNCVTTYNYDNMGNLLGRVETDNNGQSIATHWIYSAQKGKIGTLSRIVYGDSQTVSYDYDNLLRIIRVNETINEHCYSTSYAYDGANREERVSFPSGVNVLKKYSNSGYFYSLVNPDDETVFWRTESIDASGRITGYYFGNGLKTLREYDNRTGFLNGIYTSSDNEIYQDLSYSYDGFGNLVNRRNNKGSGRNESFVYDDFNRLVEIKMNGNTTGTMQYDNLGNILSKTIDNQDIFYDAHYDGTCPYTVSKVKTDLDNLIGLNQSVDYTSFDKMSHVGFANNSLSIDYGFDHKRIHSSEMVNDARKDKVYVAECEYVNDKGRNYVYTYLMGPMGVFAVMCMDEKGNDNIFYIHKDHLESWCMITNEDGKIVQSTSFDAWGNPRNDDTWSGDYYGELLCDRGFTGHEHLLTFGIINMNGRAYDPMLSMMTSPDNNLQNPDFSQNYNRYLYCYNNPLSYNDMTGEWVEWILYGVFNGLTNVISNFEYIDNFQEGVLAFGAGFVSGCLTQGLSKCSWGVQVVSSVTGSVLKAGVNGFVKKNTGNGVNWNIFDNKDFKKDMMYSIGSSLATSVLSSYISQPTEKEDGVSLNSMLCGNKVVQKTIEISAGKIAGNLFAGNYIFEGFEMNRQNMANIIPLVQSVNGMLSDGIEFEGRSETLGNVFGKLFNINASGTVKEFGDDMNEGYSWLRSLFFKNEG